MSKRFLLVHSKHMSGSDRAPFFTLSNCAVFRSGWNTGRLVAFAFGLLVRGATGSGGRELSVGWTMRLVSLAVFGARGGGTLRVQAAGLRVTDKVLMMVFLQG